MMENTKHYHQDKQLKWRVYILLKRKQLNSKFRKHDLNITWDTTS